MNVFSGRKPELWQTICLSSIKYIFWKFMLKLYISFFLLVLLSFQVFAQSSADEGGGYFIAEDFIEDESFYEAIEVYKKLLYESPNNSEFNFKMGFCYLNTPFEKQRAIYYLEKSAANYSRRRRARNNPPIEVFYYLGRAYHVTYQFEKAIETYNFMNARVRGMNTYFKDLIAREIERSTVALGYTLNPINVEIVDSFPTLNSTYSDYSPVVPIDESFIMFTSRRTENIGDETTGDGQKLEDIYLAVRTEQGFDSAQNVGDVFNTIANEAIVSLSPDGRQAFIYRDEDEGSLYTSFRIGMVWTKPVALNALINTPNRETHACLSPDGKSLYFTSDRKKGYGGLDIWVSRKTPAGDWGEPENLGPSVNTPYDEEAPYMFADNKTLFFSSRGHENMGGYDVFYINLEKKGKWSSAENIGYPINTTEDDLFFWPMPDGKHVYIASRTIDGGPHYPNIYKVRIFGLDVGAVSTVSGVVSICNEPLPPVTIRALDLNSGNVLNETTVDSETGKYMFLMSSEMEFKMQLLVDGSEVWSDTFASTPDSREIIRNVRLKSSSDCDESSTSVPFNETSSFYFNGLVYNKIISISSDLFESDAITFKNDAGLDSLAKYLLRNPDSIIEISAYADSRGPASYNLRLTESRALSIQKYLLNKGAIKQQIIARGYGEEYPLLNEFDSTGKYLSDNAAMNRRIEIRVLKQGKEKLLIKHTRKNSNIEHS